MDKDSKFTRDEDGYIAVRTVSAPYSSGTDDKDSMFTTDEDGYVAVRTINGAGSGGGDSHNKGYFATQAALEEAYPTAEAGDWAIVGATDTVWIWDEDSSAWVDSDQKGQVTSVNNQTGAVVLTASDVGALPDTTTIPDPIQYSSMPTAAASNEGDIVQFTGTTDANYTNGYFYKCVSDGQNPATYSWAQTNVQPAPSGLPDQTGQSGKFLTTDGTDASWGDLSALENSGVNGTVAVYAVKENLPSSTSNCTLVGVCDTYEIANVTCATVVGYYFYKPSNYATGIGALVRATGTGSIAIGAGARTFANGAIQISAASTSGYGITNADNSDANTVKIANENGNFEIMNATGNLPADRLASTTGLADGNYKLRLTMADGVPTLSWVAE